MLEGLSQVLLVSSLDAIGLKQRGGDQEFDRSQAQRLFRRKFWRGGEGPAMRRLRDFANVKSFPCSQLQWASF